MDHATLVSAVQEVIRAEVHPIQIEISSLRTDVSSLVSLHDVVGKYEKLKEEHAVLKEEHTGLLTRLNTVHTEKGDLANKVIELTSANGVLSDRCSVRLGQDGEQQLLDVLKESFGWCKIIDTHANPNSGDTILEVPRNGQLIRILIDRKNWDSGHVQSRHFDKGIQDAIKREADAVLIVYTKFPNKYKDGFCEGVDVANKYTVPFNTNNVMACSMNTVVSAIYKLATNIVMYKETPEMSNAMRDFSEKYSKKMTECFLESAPFLDMMNLKKFKEAAEEMQTGVTFAKRWAAAPPYQEEKKSILDALSIFEEGRKNEYILGGQLSNNFEYNKVELELPNSCKRQRVDDE